MRPEPAPRDAQPIPPLPPRATPGTPMRCDALLEHAPCGFASFADDGRLTVVNATLATMLGYTPDELVGRHVETLLTLPGRIFFQTHLFPLVRLHGRADEIFLVLRGKTGEELGVLVNAQRHERGGTLANDCVFMQVRERRKYEEELLRAKQAAEQARAVVERRERDVARANRLLEEQAAELELQQQQLQEQAVELETAGEELRAINDALRARGEELERQRTRADEANRAKSQFLANMSHELRTPLNAIGGYAALLDLGIHGPVTAAQREALGRIERSQRHLLGLINDVLNLARIEAGRVDYDIVDVPLAALVASTLPMVEPQLAAKALRCAVDVAPMLAARADAEKLEQVLLNLLTNAVKFTPDGGQIAITATERAGAPGLVFLRVADTGIGIPRDKLERVFEPFVQVDPSHTRRHDGTGLGLAISRDLARGMGGDLRARSMEGRGSAFTVTLRRGGAP